MVPKENGSQGGRLKAPIVNILAMTFALNMLSLSVPLAAQLIFNRILLVPGSSTLLLVVYGVAILAALEAVIRLARSYLLLETSRVATAKLTSRVLKHIVTSDYSAGARGAARSLDYFGRIAQVAEKHSGKLLVGVAELMFLPVILTLIFFIAPVVGALVCGCLAVGLFVTLTGAFAFRRNALLLNRQVERRYRFLLTILTAIHPLKALGIEDFILRRYEHIQAGVARISMKTSENSSRLLNGTLVTNQAITATSLIYGAYAVNNGSMTLGAVSATVLLGGRLMAPLQRAVFIFIQARDLCEAEEILSDVLKHKASRTALEAVDAENEGALELRDVAIGSGGWDAGGGVSNINLKVFPGEMVVINGGEEATRTELLKVAAGIHSPHAGEVIVNGQPVADYPQQQLNRTAAYVSGEAIMFHGTIRENITRFGEISLEEALSVAAMMELQGAINELPRGLDTQLTGTVNENVPTSLCQQLAILRALTFRPRLIMLDNVARGLDRQSYARLQRFIARIQGQATLIIVSNDRNITAGAKTRLTLTPQGLRPDYSLANRELKAYRSLKL